MRELPQWVRPYLWSTCRWMRAAVRTSGAGLPHPPSGLCRLCVSGLVENQDGPGPFWAKGAGESVLSISGRGGRKRFRQAARS